MKIKLIILIILLSNFASAKIIISEVMPNPKGLDKDNEWVELYNTGTERLSLASCILYDEKESNELYITDEYIESGQYLKIDRAGDSDFNLNNRGDKVRLFCNKTLISEMQYFACKEGMSKALTKNGWVDQMPTPGMQNLAANQTDCCDWEVKLLIEDLISTRVNWRTRVVKNAGSKNTLTLYREILDINNNTIKKYIPLKIEASQKKTIRNNPRLKPGTYILNARIISHDCKDILAENNEISTLFYILGENATNSFKKPETLNITKNSCICEKTVFVLNNTGSIYESNDHKAKRYAIYFFCFLLILLIIALQVEKNEKSRNNCKDDT